jgi:hypothetical protein
MGGDITSEEALRSPEGLPHTMFQHTKKPKFFID